jgi:hypothetical protein
MAAAGAAHAAAAGGHTVNVVNTLLVITMILRAAEHPRHPTMLVLNTQIMKICLILTKLKA